jgi:hypothetical protein
MAGFTFSFKPRFVNSIRAGLGLEDYAAPRFAPSLGKKKRQTIRVERKDGKRPRAGDEIILYTGMRTKACQAVAPRNSAFCTDVFSIGLMFVNGALRDVAIGGSLAEFDTRFASLDAFAQADGFADAAEMSEFWRAEHGDLTLFRGFITFWEAPEAKAA